MATPIGKRDFATSDGIAIINNWLMHLIGEVINVETVDIGVNDCMGNHEINMVTRVWYKLR